jgi:hypothetical protein
MVPLKGSENDKDKEEEDDELIDLGNWHNQTNSI